MPDIVREPSQEALPGGVVNLCRVGSLETETIPCSVTLCVRHGATEGLDEPPDKNLQFIRTFLFGPGAKRGDV
ncbi:hypothetical protein ATY79_14385 [Rhizobium sp. R693]|nr:hypothetical protein ATY79_14385 [Rhizobium sp. R693]